MTPDKLVAEALQSGSIDFKVNCLSLVNHDLVFKTEMCGAIISILFLTLCYLILSKHLEKASCISGISSY